MFDTFTLGALSGYIRQSPIEVGKWRLALRAIRRAREIGPRMGQRIVWTKHRFRMRLDLADWVDQHIYATGEYEPDVVAVATAALRPGLTAVDIGANVGFFSLLFASLVGPSGKVIALEPQPRAYGRLVENLALNQRLKADVRRVAASDTVGQLYFYCGPAEHSGIASLRPLGGSPERITVPTATGDSLFRECEQIDLIKVDVEGAETLVLRGLSSAIDRCRPDLIIEVSNRYLQEMGSSGRELCGLLCHRGYKMFQIGWNGLTPVVGWDDGLTDQFNALFTYQPERFSQLIRR
jgi:FkbM family methyltransferase